MADIAANPTSPLPTDDMPWIETGPGESFRPLRFEGRRILGADPPRTRQRRAASSAHGRYAHLQPARQPRTDREW
jgi:hypothetical protein